MRLLLILSFISTALFAEPSRTIPDNLFKDFTLNGRIPVIYNYRNDSSSKDASLFYDKKQVDEYILDAKKKTGYFGKTDTYLYNALQENLSKIVTKNVAIIGSVTPWYESIVLAHGGKPTTIDYNEIKTNDSRLELLTVEEYNQNPKKFDAIISISSFEHEGLGRYGDPMNPNGDLLAMENASKMLKDDGILFLAVPVGKDCLVWNLHRVYGHLRLKKLLSGWRIIKYYGFTSEDLYKDASVTVHQPIFVLKKIIK